MAEHADIYADGFSISAGAFGVTLTLLRSEPTGEPGAHAEPNVIVGRIRLSPSLATAIADALAQTVIAAAQSSVETQTTVRH